MTITHSNAETFGELLNAFRKRMHLTQQQLAEAIGMHRHAISRWEQGVVLPASKAIVLELARRLCLNDMEARKLLEASLVAPLPLWGVPFPRNLFFTGRKKILKTLHRYLGIDCAKAGPQVYALSGLGGVGKTQTALEYAYQYCIEYNAILWIDGENIESILSSLQRIAELLRLPEKTEMEQQLVVKAVQGWLATHDNWLIIWDNLEDIELPHRLLPPGPHGAFLFTTRRQTLGTLACRIDLLPMGPEEGILFLLRRAKILEPDVTIEQLPQAALNMPTEYAAASELVTTLGGLPLALDQTGAYVEETGCSLRSYLACFKQQRAYLLNRRGCPVGEHPHSVTTTFLLAKERAEQELNNIVDLLYVCAFLHPEAIPEELFCLGAIHLGPTLAPIVADPIQFDLALAALRTLSLLQRQPQTQTLSLHRLVQAVLRDCIGPAETRIWSERVIRMVNAAFPEEIAATSVQCERYLMQALACLPLIDLAKDALFEAGELCYKAGGYLMARGRYEEAAPLLEQMITLGKQYPNFDQSTMISWLKRRAELSWRQGNYEQAEELLYQELQLEKRLLGLHHPQTARTLNNLAMVYDEQGNFEEAEPLYQQALDVKEHLAGPEHPDTAAALNNLAFLNWFHRKRYAEAERQYLRALAIWERKLGPEHLDTVFSLIGLADMYQSQGRNEEAEPLYLRALSIREAQLGLEHPDIAFPLTGLANLYRDQGRNEEAEPLYLRALSIREQRVGPEHLYTAITLAGLANLYRDQGRYGEAEPLYLRALLISKRCLGEAHPETIKIGADYSILVAQRNDGEKPQKDKR
ncbi:tetratricopeptide repeat protein [Ktedonosporobacter rubrisoli]|uniref:Tetratricopeptide repeat protein n=1 Tax=Ktedonosporobacter rubrisoli TaxID=2509675 RepID=A0A4P6K4L1_KTERU|nr:FxSxx-COOH system tetratricopeptide repeat protein [Ktedonosporobacter rubrisoli]QBD82995.1 tetratricopeptide repeat protein [Ktedonosporobacter rubrisoli]